MRKSSAVNIDELRFVFSERMQTLLDRKGKKPTDVQREMGVPVQTVRSWLDEKKPKITSPEMLLKISQTYNVTIDWLLGGPGTGVVFDWPVLFEGICDEVLGRVLSAIELKWGGEKPDMAKLKSGAIVACMGLLGLYTEVRPPNAMETLRVHEEVMGHIQRALLAPGKK